jgi:hypothetical protein
MIERGLSDVLREVELWEGIHGRAEELERRGLRLRHGGLSRLLEEGRSR